MASAQPIKTPPKAPQPQQTAKPAKSAEDDQDQPTVFRDFASI